MRSSSTVSRYIPFETESTKLPRTAARPFPSHVTAGEVIRQREHCNSIGDGKRFLSSQRLLEQPGIERERVLAHERDQSRLVVHMVYHNISVRRSLDRDDNRRYDQYRATSAGMPFVALSLGKAIFCHPPIRQIRSQDFLYL